MGGKNSKRAAPSRYSSFGSSSNSWGQTDYPQSPYQHGPQPSQPYASPAPFQGYGGQATASKGKLERKYSKIDDDYSSLEQVTDALARAGLESSNLIVGVDFTKSNEWTGARSFNRDQEDSRPADDDALKQILTLELQNMALKQTINEAIESKSEGQALSQFIDEAALSNDCKRNGVVKEMDHEFGDSVKARVFGENENVYSMKDGIGLDGWNGGTEEKEKKERDELDGWNSGTEEEEKMERDELDGWNSGIEERKKEREEFDEWNGGIEEGKREELEYESVYHVGEDSGAVGVQEDAKSSSYHYPLRPDAEDCSFYMRTGACKFGSNCKFNHPFKRKNRMFKQTLRQKDENSDRQGQTECKYYLSSGGCKYGKACKFSHTRGRPAVAPIAEFNFLDLPIRKGEKECPFYMRTGYCKYGLDCRFNHPDPTAG